MNRLYNFSGLVVLLISVVILSVQGGPPAKRSLHPLPSVTDAHYREIVTDGRHAHSGQHLNVHERRLEDGTVEGESLYIRPDGNAVRVHFFADGKSQRPKSELHIRERVVSSARHVVPVVTNRRVVVPEVRQVVDVLSPPPVAVVAPPRSDSARVHFADTKNGQGVGLATNGDVAAAVPSITAIVGPGATAEISPEAEAVSGPNAIFRSSGSGGDIAFANPQVTAIAGAGSSVVIKPKARAVSGNAAPVREIHHHGTTQVVTPVERVIAPHVVERVLAPVPKVVATHADPGYVYASPKTLVPTVTAVRAQGVLVVPPKPSYSYTYSYSAPDGKHPQRDNSAYVNVNVNH